MFVSNNTQHVRYFFYKTLGGMPKSVKFGPLEGMEIVDLESTNQITYNALDFKLVGINERLGTSFVTSTKSEKYLKLTLTDLGTWLSEVYFNNGWDLTSIDGCSTAFGSNLTAIKTEGNSIIFIGTYMDFNPSYINADYSLYRSYQDYGMGLFFEDWSSCVNLVEFYTLSSSVNTLALQNCTSLVSFSAPNMIGTLNSGFLSQCVSLQSVNLPQIKVLQSLTFDTCSALTEVNLQSLTGMTGARNFDFCSSLQSISLPNLTNMGAGATLTFRNCTSLQSADLPLCPSIRNNTFENSTSLQTIYVPSCTSLGSSVLNNNVFLGITGQTMTLTIKASRMTANSGNPDGDIQYLQSANTLTVIQT